MKNTVEEKDAPEKFKRLAESLHQESDRGAAILGAALLDEALEELLRAFFRQDARRVRKAIDPLFRGYAPLATFSAKVQVSYALGILPEDIRDDIEIVRNIRNDFAHEWGALNFDHPKCVARLNRISRPKQGVGSTVHEGHGKDVAQRHRTSPHEGFIGRVAFLLCVQSLVSRIGVLAELAREGHDIRVVVLAQEARSGTAAAQQREEADKAREH